MYPSVELWLLFSKWYHGLALVLDSSLLNAFKQYQDDATTAGLAIYLRQLWHYTLATQLVAPLIRVNVSRGPM